MVCCGDVGDMQLMDCGCYYAEDGVIVLMCWCCVVVLRIGCVVVDLQLFLQRWCWFLRR